MRNGVIAASMTVLPASLAAGALAQATPPETATPVAGRSLPYGIQPADPGIAFVELEAAPVTMGLVLPRDTTAVEVPQPRRCRSTSTSCRSSRATKNAARRVNTATGR